MSSISPEKFKTLAPKDRRTLLEFTRDGRILMYTLELLTSIPANELEKLDATIKFVDDEFVLGGSPETIHDIRARLLKLNIQPLSYEFKYITYGLNNFFTIANQWQ